jgi:dihydropteroate synthase
MSFKVVTHQFQQEFDRWTDALETANQMKPQLKSWFRDIRIFDGADLVWMYSKLRAYPEYIGPGTYDRLARLFIAEAQQVASSRQPWQIRQHTFNWGERTYLMGILNVTPDSFSDGGQFNTLEAALQQAQQLADLDILDIGGQSTRPGAEQISLGEELNRVIPIIEALRASPDPRLQTLPISIDTTRATVARAALEAGADIINDISGGTYDPEILTVAAAKTTPMILMHLRGTPATMQQQTDYTDLIGEISDFLRTQIDRALQAGIPKQHICIDPGIGFAKTWDQNLTLLRQLSQFSMLDYPMLVGPSRKSFIGKLLDQPDPKQRLWGTAAACSAAIAGGADILRVHDPEMLQVARVADAIWRS